MHKDIKRKKLLYRSIHRGIKETDMLLGEFAKKNIFDLTDEEIHQYEKIVEMNDFVLYGYLSEREVVSEDMPLLKIIVQFNKSRLSNN